LSKSAIETSKYITPEAKPTRLCLDFYINIFSWRQREKVKEKGDDMIGTRSD
jgi:hypothetical protein